MKLKFKNQKFQTDAVNSVADLFIGQEKAKMTFSIDSNVGNFDLIMSEFGIGNKLEISQDDLIKNMHTIQRRNQLPITRPWLNKIDNGKWKIIFIFNFQLSIFNSINPRSCNR